MYEFIVKFAPLINIALFGTIIGWLFHISRFYRTALIDKYDAKLATKDGQLQTCQNNLELKDEKIQLFKDRIDILEKQGPEMLLETMQKRIDIQMEEIIRLRADGEGNKEEVERKEDDLRTVLNRLDGVVDHYPLGRPP